MFVTSTGARILDGVATKSIIIGESTWAPAREGFARFGYLELMNEFDVKLIDLNEGEWVFLDVYDSALHPMPRRLLQASFLTVLTRFLLTKRRTLLAL